MMKTVITYLRHGALTYHYVTEIPKEGPGSGEYGPFNNMFPITPLELHEGWILGKERIITAISGTYEWRHPQKPEVLVFDITGRPLPALADLRQTKDGWTVVLKLEDWESIGVIR